MSNMHAIVVRTLGDPSVLCPEVMPVPSTREDQVLVRLHAIGVNYSETERRRGLYATPELPWIPGSEGAGTIVDVGRGVSKEWLGKRVAFWAMPPETSGTYAEFAATSVSSLFVLPTDLSWEVAAAIPLQGLTAYGIAYVATHIRHGQHVLVHAAAGGIGQWLLQMYRLQGAHVYGTASAESKLDVIRKQGANAFVYGDRLTSEILRATGGAGVDLIVDSVGKPLQKMNFDLLAPYGELLQYGEAGGAPDPVRVDDLYGKCLKVGAFGLDVSRQPDLWQEARKRLVDWVLRGDIRPVISRTFKLSDVASAHRLLESRSSTGKMVLIPD